MTDPIALAKDVLRLEIDGLSALREGLGPSFVHMVELLQKTTGRVVVTGMGKSGHVARKVAATFASTGTAALYVHPAEASHGDLGMITAADCILAFSKSGETEELSDIIAFAKRFDIAVGAIATKAGSTLTQNAKVAIVLPDAPEACGETRAPTTSTTMMMAVGDALAVTLLRLHGFTAADFKNYHPGGNLGAALKRVEEMMHGADSLPLCSDGALLNEAVDVLNKGGFGCVGLIDKNHQLTGILTDGDLRRHFKQVRNDTPVRDVMTVSPKVVSRETLAGDALRILSDGKITCLFVVENNKPIGLLHVHDCLALGVL